MWARRDSNPLAVLAGCISTALRQGLVRRAPATRQAQRRVTPAEVDALTMLYRDGATIEALATMFGLHRTTVMEHLDRENVERRRRGLDNDEIARAAELYAAGDSLATVGKTLGVDGATIRRAVLAAGAAIRPRRGWAS